jgi:hypothetical protein
MPSFTNESTGVVVSVSDSTAARLGREWVAEKAKPASRSSKKSETKSDED